LLGFSVRIVYQEMAFSAGNWTCTDVYPGQSAIALASTQLFPSYFLFFYLTTLRLEKKNLVGNVGYRI